MHPNDLRSPLQAKFGGGAITALIKALKKHVPDERARRAIYRVMLIDFCCKGDWDCEDECKGKDPAYDAALSALRREDPRFAADD